MDCCHSGSNTRALFPPDAKRIPRYLPNPWDIMAEESGRKLRGKVSRHTAPLDGSDAQALGHRHRGHSRGADHRLPGYADFRRRLSRRHLQRGADLLADHGSCARPKGNIGNRELHARAISWLKGEDFDQVPQLEGRKDSLDRQFLAPIA